MKAYFLAPLFALLTIAYPDGLEVYASVDRSIEDSFTSANSTLTPPNRTVPEIARQVTVRILSDAAGTGSGVIINRQGQTYTVLTNHHVIASNNGSYKILTSDGVSHSAYPLNSNRFGSYDLALVQFTSDRSYQVVAMGNSSTLSVGEMVYASGFPAWHYTYNGNIPVRLEDTRNWGNRAFKLTAGTVEMLEIQALGGGYQLGYTNDIEQGMSGGPVLNQRGELVAINGRLKYPLQGLSLGLPSHIARQMEALSWAIPTHIFSPQLN